MRTEEILNEAKGFNKDKMAYVHAEMYDLKRGTAVVAGDEAAIVITIYNIIEAFAQTRYEDISFHEMSREIRKCLKALRKLHRLTVKLGEPMFSKEEIDVDSD